MNKIKRLFNQHSVTTSKEAPVFVYPLYGEASIKEELVSSQTIKAYTCKVELGFSGTCAQDEFSLMFRRLLDEMSEEVYGDIRKMLLKGFEGCYARDFNKVMEVLNSIERYILE